jgi:hypothetical protein
MNLSGWVFFSLFAILIAYDVVIIALRGYQATVSAFLLNFSKRFPIVPFAGGVLIGHLFWPNLAGCAERDPFNAFHPKVGESVPSADLKKSCMYLGDGQYSCVVVP